VVRNRLRRRLREAVEALARQGQVPPGAYLVSVAPPAAGQRFEELKENVATTLRAASAPGAPR
jgi:ribonuclease P protein component